ncbi:MAG: UPF0182 family protein [Nitrospirae bacterium]|nr:UPF0182 family protein [Nitrospirota bacterium]
MSKGNGAFKGAPRLRGGPIAALAILFFLLSASGRVVQVVTDYWWFQEIAMTPAFWVMLGSKIKLGLLAGAAAGAVIYVSVWLSLRGGREMVVREERDVIEFPAARMKLGAMKITGALVSLLLAYWIGMWASNRWSVVLEFYNGVAFGEVDPLFGKDIRFYVYSLPFYRFIGGWATAVIVLSLLATGLIRAMLGQLEWGTSGAKVSSSARSHLLILAGLFCVILAYRFHLSMYDLASAQRAIAPGAGYADIHAYLPALKVLRLVALLSALLSWAAIWIPGVRLPAVAAGLIAVGFFGARGYREFVQRFDVAPNEVVRETPYIQWGIRNTRAAFGLEGVQELEFDPSESLTANDLRRNEGTLKNVRLWDHAPLLTTYSQLQEIRTYYDFMDVDNDRYWVEGEYRQVMLSPRELNPASLPSRIWINEHLTYTHGYGVCMGPVNRITPEGLPEFFVKDIPPVSRAGLKVTRPEIYFGEARGVYSIVNTQAKEFDYPAGEENVYSQYSGRGGIPFTGSLRKLLFSTRLKELKLLLSRDITAESRIMIYRNIQERVTKAAPFLLYDRDPYLILTDEGRLVWMVDAYTTTSRYPYAEVVRGIGNYMRNSVKVTVDAYDGTVTFYAADERDPLIRTYQRIFPEVFKPLAQMPKDVRSHVRYPQTLLMVQAMVYGTYHMTDPQVFYNKEDLWRIAQRSGGDAMEPYYTIMKLAGVGQSEEFILMVPFTPSKKENMIAWMAARCDDPNYGGLLVYNFPKQKLVYGPGQISSRIDQDPEISKQLTLWGQGGSRVIRGSLLVIPVDRSLLYVQPLYLESEGGGLPEAKRVIVAFGNSIAMEATLEESLERIFGRGSKVSGSAATAPGAPAPNLRTDAGVSELTRQAREHYDRAQERLKAGDWAAFGYELQKLGEILKRLQEKR